LLRRSAICYGTLLLAAAGFGQRAFYRDRSVPGAGFDKSAEYHFIRIEYTDLPRAARRFGWSSRSGSGSGWWRMDWPDAERHFTKGIERLTRIRVGEPIHFRLTDPRLFDHPWIYATQVGWWDLGKEEIARLREYLLKGGFLLVDDFYGEEQWEVFRRTMALVFPDQPIVEIPEDDSMMHVLYDIWMKDREFIPGSRHLRHGPGGRITIEQPLGTEPGWRALYDAKNRMVVAVPYNMDVADAWEFADWPEYPESKTTLAYRYGINSIIYAMTH
jgi:hypothetical protein